MGRNLEITEKLQKYIDNFNIYIITDSQYSIQVLTSTGEKYLLTDFKKEIKPSREYQFNLLDKEII